jgi:prevent-host-death family protein
MLGLELVEKFSRAESILSIIDKLGGDNMRFFSATAAKQRLAALLDAAQREPVVIRRHERDVAVLLSAEEYDRLRDLNAAEFQRFCDRVSDQAEARGMTETVLNELLADEG